MRSLLTLCLLAGPAFAEAPLIESASARQTGDTWSISATISHPDTGWDHYADAFRVELADGSELGTRVLVHPHETEQPFTRSLDSLTIPEGTKRVYLRARCLVDGWSGEVLALQLGEN